MWKSMKWYFDRKQEQYASLICDKDMIRYELFRLAIFPEIWKYVFSPLALIWKPDKDRIYLLEVNKTGNPFLFPIFFLCVVITKNWSPDKTWNRTWKSTRLYGTGKKRKRMGGSRQRKKGRCCSNWMEIVYHWFPAKSFAEV